MKGLLDSIDRALQALMTLGSYVLAFALGAFALYVIGAMFGLPPGDWDAAPLIVPVLMAGCALVLSVAFYLFARTSRPEKIDKHVRPALFYVAQVLALAPILVAIELDSGFGWDARSRLAIRLGLLLFGLGCLLGWRRLARSWPTQGARQSPSDLASSPESHA